MESNFGFKNKIICPHFCKFWANFPKNYPMAFILNAPILSTNNARDKCDHSGIITLYRFSFEGILKF